MATIKDLNIPAQYFWEYKDPESISLEESSLLVTERILKYGTINEMLRLEKYYGLSDFIAIITQIRYLDKIILNFLTVVYEIPKERFRCYTMRQSRLTYWND